MKNIFWSLAKISSKVKSNRQIKLSLSKSLKNTVRKFDLSVEHENRDWEREKGRVREQFPSRLFIKGVCDGSTHFWLQTLWIKKRKTYFQDWIKSFLKEKNSKIVTSEYNLPTCINARIIYELINLKFKYGMCHLNDFSTLKIFQNNYCILKLIIVY